jgi:methionine synthase II (cobalamin-independent)
MTISISFFQSNNSQFEIEKTFTHPLGGVSQYVSWSPNDEFIIVILSKSGISADLMIFESARSTHDIIGNISSYRYNGNIAIGLYDPTSYHIPSTKDMHDTLKLAIRSFDFDKIWITYDSLFKTSQIDTEQGFKNLIEAVKICRQKYSKFSD